MTSLRRPKLETFCHALLWLIRHPEAYCAPSRKTAADEDFGLRVSLSDALCNENVEVVRKLDLYPEYEAATFLAAWIAASLVAPPALSRGRHRQ